MRRILFLSKTILNCKIIVSYHKYMLISYIKITIFYKAYLEFPSNNISPLVIFKRKVSVTLDPIGKSWVENSFTCRSDSDFLYEINDDFF
jgi:hypothetical protein